MFINDNTFSHLADAQNQTQVLLVFLYLLTQNDIPMNITFWKMYRLSESKHSVKNALMTHLILAANSLE